MNPSEAVTEMAELHLAFEDYCFTYVSDNLTVQISTRSTKPDDLVLAFISYMKALGFGIKEIEIALCTQAVLMKLANDPSLGFKSKE